MLIFLPISVTINAIASLLKALTFGLTFMIHALLCSLIWAPIVGLLLGTSYLWLKYWYMRPLLLIPGLSLVIVGELILMLSPTPSIADRDGRLFQVDMAEEWPLSWRIAKAMQPPEGGKSRCIGCGSQNGMTNRYCTTCGASLQ